MKVAVVDSGGANIGSVCFALQRLGIEPLLAADPQSLQEAECVILPGVGAAAPAMARLRELNLVQVIRQLDRPLLGICLGMQLLFESSAEGDVDCLGLLPGRVEKMPTVNGARVPHMGWNRLQTRRQSPLMRGIASGAQVYFVHSYAVAVGDACVASCEHGAAFAAVVQRGHIAGAQFHPERSGAAGAVLLENFLSAALP